MTSIPTQQQINKNADESRSCGSSDLVTMASIPMHPLCSEALPTVNSINQTPSKLISMEPRSEACDQPADRSAPWSFFRIASQVHGRSHGLRSTTTMIIDKENNHRPLKLSKRKQVLPLWTEQDFDLSGVVGKGHYGVVFKARRKDDRQRVALKRLSKEKITDDKQRGGKAMKLLQREIENHSHLRHIHIAGFHGYFEDCDSVHLVLNYARLGNLHAYIDTVDNGILPIERARMYLRQVASALDYLASAHVAHRDLKQENIILVARDTVQLCDFGWSIRYAKGQNQSTLCGTPLYVPPEMLVTTAYDPKPVDLWALGVLAHELILNESPFDLDDSEWNNCNDAKDDDARFQRRVIFDKLTQFTKWSWPAGNQDHRAMDFIAKLLIKDPKARMVASDALCHPFLLDQESLDGNQIVCKTPRPGLIRKLQSFIPKKRKSSLRPAGYDRLTFDPDNEGLSWANTHSSGHQSSVKRRRIH